MSQNKKKDKKSTKIKESMILGQKTINDNDTENEIIDINNTLDQEVGEILNRTMHQNKEILVLSGGSTKGVAQLGALHCLKKHNLLNNIKTVAASSVGSAIGMLLCAGYQPMEFFKFIKLVNLNQMKKLEAQNVITKYGLDDGTRLMLVLVKLLSARGYAEDITFKEFYKKTKINLIVTGACVNDKKIHYFSHSNYPNMKVLDAIRISMSVPIIFTPCVFEGKIFVDGGCIDNFPIHLFDHEMNKVIGVYVSETRNVVKEIKFIEDYLVNTMECMFEGLTHRDTRTYDKHIIQVRCSKSSEAMADLINMFDEGFDAAQKKIDSGDLE